jgi:hypothetical protein
MDTYIDEVRAKEENLMKRKKIDAPCFLSEEQERAGTFCDLLGVS